MSKLRDQAQRLTLPEKASLCSGGSSWSTQAIPAKGIPSAVMTDGTYGVRFCKPGEECVDGVEAMTVVELNLESDSEQLSKYHRATCFPSPSAFACSWDGELIAAMAAYIARECRALGVDLLLAPAINIRRDPRGGRGFEYYSEDPRLTAGLASAFVKGLQSQGVGACLKHFACNNSEYQRTLMDSVVEERPLREIYLYAFQTIIRDCDPWAVMSSYNRLNGEQAAESPTLLRKILRDEWGYDGLVVSDWGGIKDRVAALRASGDLEMPRNQLFDREIEEAVCTGALSEAVLEESVGRVLAFLDRVEVGRAQALPPTDFGEGYRLAVRVAEESAVLLKNVGRLLPLDATRVKRIAVVGDIAKSPRYQGGGCAVVNPTSISVPFDELARVAGEEVNVSFSPGYTHEDGTTPALLREVTSAAAQADVAIVFAGVKIRDDTEGFNRSTLALEAAHVAAIHAAARGNPRVVVVLSNGEAVTMGEFLDEVPAVLECFFGGQGGGTAVANLLFGLTNPSGKLTTTFPKREEDLPGYLTFPGEFGRHPYSEGIFVGYRFYDKRAITPLFAFGHGLSYTNFTYAGLEVSVRTEQGRVLLDVRAQISNTGVRPGKEIVQFYVEPLSVSGQAPVRALAAYQKLAVEPRATATARVEIDCEDAFCHYDPELGHNTPVPGDYRLCCGASSRDLRLFCGLTVACAPPFKPLRRDSLHRDLFEDADARELYLDYLRRIHVIGVQTHVESAVTSLCNMFWGLHRALIALSIADPTIRVDAAELDAVLAQMNQKRLRRWQALSHLIQISVEK